MNTWNLDKCLKCSALMTPNKDQICVKCSLKPCNWCNKATNSKAKPPACTHCAKLSMKKKLAMKEKTQRNPGDLLS